jgi:hypothetical protein
MAIYDQRSKDLQKHSDNTFCGFVEWTNGGKYYKLEGKTFTLLRGGWGLIRNQRVDWKPNQQITLQNNATLYIYIDKNGLIQGAATALKEVYENNIVLFEVFCNGTYHNTVKENHPYNFQLEVSRFIHSNLGVIIQGSGAIITRVATGTGAAAGDREIKIVGNDLLEDHGLETIIPDSGGAGVTWNIFYTDAQGRWKRYLQQTQMPMVYNNNGVPTALNTVGNTTRALFTLYVSKDNLNDPTPTYYAIMDDSTYTQQAAALQDIADGKFTRATPPLSNLELAQLGVIEVQNNVLGGYIEQVVVLKSTLRGGLIPGNANSASLVTTSTANFNNILSSLDSTVQAALDTLDDHLHDDRYYTETETDALLAAKVTGPASASDNAIARYDGTTGKVIQNSGSYVDDNGHVLIGASAPTTGNPRLFIDPTNSFESVLIYNTTGDFRIMLVTADGRVFLDQVYNDTVGATNRDLYIDNTGKLGYVSSSRKYKKNIQAFDRHGDVYKLNPITFDYKDKTKGTSQIGLIAEEVAELFPEVVSYDSKTKEPESINYTKLVPILISTIKDLNSRLEAIEKKLK